MDIKCLFSLVNIIIDFWLMKFIRRIFVLQK